MYTPSETDILRIQHLVEDAERDLERYDTEIGAITQILNKLQEQRKTLHRYTDEHKSLLAPVRRLPAELLSEIFAFAICPEGLTIYPGHVGAPTLTLSHTCNVWRNIVYSRPTLWSCLNIDFGNSTPRTMLLLQQYLDRSGNVPLTFKISATAGTDDEDDLDELHENGWKTLEIILSHRLKWKEATFLLHRDIYTEGFHRMRHIPRPTDWSLDRLEVLNIHWTYASLLLEENTFFHLFVRWPALRSLSLDAFHSFLPFPFEKLKELRICDHWVDGSPEDMLELCGGLEHLSLEVGDGFDELDMTHKNLQSLELHVDDEHAAIALRGVDVAMFDEVATVRVSCRSGRVRAAKF
ncbi:hypothetical protein D9758_015966 [Tetrapyrgos nigripes]|uniref:F-box domain-containing protein n=1 Tax=Tetrapyrgos nigripes TaxID=182062 RepID=A0A8H5C2G2_9AGAR|nr:hypothetical protein D9758_015966 [Tetrapyrgos nigripes]